MLGRPFNDHDFTQYDLDAPFPDVEALGTNSNQSATVRVTRAARERASHFIEMVGLNAAQGYAQVSGKAQAMVIHVDSGTLTLGVADTLNGSLKASAAIVVKTATTSGGTGGTGGGGEKV